MSGFWMIPDDYEYAQATFNGSAHSISEEVSADPAQAVRDIAEEVTGKEFPARRIGFY
jgi:septum formation inhibitor-activating ATPase MinD